MNKATRILVMAGMALVAGATVGAGPASAAPATPANTTTKASTAHWHDGRDRIVGYYRNPFTCNRVGYVGERQGRWDDHDCNRVRFGPRRGWWALQVSSDRRGHDWNNGGGDWDNGGGNWNHGPWN